MALTYDALKPSARAYILAYGFSVAPHLATRLLKCSRSIGKNRNGQLQDDLKALATILRTSTEIHRFPFAATLIVASSTLLPSVCVSLLRWLARLIHKEPASITKPFFSRQLRAVCSFLGAWIAFNLLNNRDKDWARKRARSRGAQDAEIYGSDNPNQHHRPQHVSQYAGKTIDFTLFALCRALDVAVIAAWSRTRSKRWHPERQLPPQLLEFGNKLIDPCIFAASSSVIMFAWFYAPERLPKSYNLWISRAAQIDGRLIRALRLCRQGVFVYGRDTGQAPLLKSLCNELGLPEQWGDPVETIPIPCPLYHQGEPSCEVHALTRFMKSFEYSMGLYLPLNIVSKLRRPGKAAFVLALKDSVQSASFLASFISVFYYAVCLARTRLGPKLFSRKTITPQMWDSGLCVLAGCLLCGWSILLEAPARRQEIAFFVAPRALATLMPRVYDIRHRRKEQLVFALSVAFVLDAVKNRPNGSVRGVFGRILQRVMKGGE